MQKLGKRAISAATVASLLITSSTAAVSVKAAVTPPENPRLWGQDRYETAVKVSQAGWTTGSDYAVIASGEGYADALCAAPLAKANNAPILLTQKGILTENTLNELKRLKVKHVFIIGGQGVVSQEVENKIKSEITSDIQRLWGQNRYETAVKVAEKIGTPAKVVLASGDGYADALSAAPVAAVEGMPILLTESSTLSTATANYIKANAGITKTYVIGGTASVSDATMKDVPNAQRLGGADRYETNAKVIDAFSTDFNFKNAYVALGNGPTGNEFADALSASAIAAKNGNAVIITNKSLNSTTQTLAKSKLFPSSTITVIGGTANVPNEVVTGMKVSGSLLSEAGKTYTDAIDGNVEITADNVALKGNVKGDLYLSGNNASISNITVDGTVYVDPGATGVSNLDTVNAKNIVILSGAKDSIHLKNVKADKLTVRSRDNVRIASEGTTVISNTVVSSQAILEATAGSFGNVNLAQTAVEKTVELRGTFDKPVVVAGQVNLKAAANANIAKLEIAPQAKQDKVNIDGNFKDVEVTKEANLNVAATAKITGTVTLKVVAVITTAKGADIANLVVTAEVKGANIEFNGEGTIKNIQNKSVLVVIDISKDVSVTGKIESVNKDNVTSENTSTTGKVEEKSSDNMTDISTGTTTPPAAGGGSTGGGNTGSQTEQNYYMTATTSQGTFTFKLGDKATIDSMTASDFYSAYIEGREADSPSVMILASMIKDRIDSKDIKVNGQDLNVFLADILAKSGHQTTADFAASEDYESALENLFSKDYTEFSAFTHSLMDFAKIDSNISEYQKPITVDGKTVTKIEVATTAGVAGTKVYSYDTAATDDAVKINVTELRNIKASYLNGTAFGDTKMSALKDKYISIKVYLNNSATASYTIEAQGMGYTVTGPTKTYTFGVVAK